MKYLTWWAAFLSCVDETSLSPHFKMLRLESCVEGEVADTVKGLQNSEAASQATRARLNRKYGGYKRQIQKLTGIRGITTVYFTRRKVHQKKSSPDVMEESSDVPHVHGNGSSKYVSKSKRTWAAKKFPPHRSGYPETWGQALARQLLLDEGSSDTTYVNEDVVEEKVTIKVANDQKSISYVDYNRDWIGELRQSNGHYYCCVDIAQYLWMNETYQLASVKRSVERNVPFPTRGKRSKIDFLIGSDHNNLLFLVREVRGGDGEPIARLCPRGWTAISTIDVCERHDACNTGFFSAFRMQTSDSNGWGLNDRMKQFWSLEATNNTSQVNRRLTSDGKLAFNKVKESIRFTGERYEVVVSWKHDRLNLPSHRPTTEKLLRSVEKKSKQNEKLA